MNLNPNTLSAITSVLGLINPALGIIGAFVGEASAGKVRKIASDVQDAVGVVNALAPLVTSFGAGNAVTPEDVTAALAGMPGALKSLNDLIALREADAGKL